MRTIVSQARHRGSALTAAVVALGLASEANAGNTIPSAPESPRVATNWPVTHAPQRRIRLAAYPQRRGKMSVPQRPVAVDSSPMIDDLNKALRALNATDRDYDGHREKAINHIEAAIRDLQVPNAKANAKGRSNEAAAKADAGKAADKTATASQVDKTATTPQDESDASIRKARTTLFALHHKLTDKASTAGRIHADAQVRIALDELSQALKIGAPAAAPAPGTTPAPARTAAPAPARTAAPAPARAVAPAPARGTTSK